MRTEAANKTLLAWAKADAEKADAGLLQTFGGKRFLKTISKNPAAL